MFTTFTTNYFGISVFDAFYVGHQVYVQVGLLKAFKMLDAETFEKELNCLVWPGNTEDFVTLLGSKIMEACDPAGYLIVAMNKFPKVNCALAIGEVLKDADVKFEMYKLMGI